MRRVCLQHRAKAPSDPRSPSPIPIPVHLGPPKSPSSSGESMLHWPALTFLSLDGRGACPQTRNRLPAGEGEPRGPIAPRTTDSRSPSPQTHNRTPIRQTPKGWHNLAKDGVLERCHHPIESWKDGVANPRDTNPLCKESSASSAKLAGNLHPVANLERKKWINLPSARSGSSYLQV